MDCTEGASVISANKLLAAVLTDFCAKRQEISQQEGYPSSDGPRFYKRGPPLLINLQLYYWPG
jgi:hypothetical protein